MFMIMTVLLLFVPFVEKADAYGITNQEKVVDVGKDHFVVLKEDGSVWSWGDNTYGQMGSDAPSASYKSPLQVKKPDGNRFMNATAVVAGAYHTVVLEDGKVWTWGMNSYGQLGYSSTIISGKTKAGENNEQPTEVPGLPKIIAIAAGDYHTLAVAEDGTVWAWGRNAFGQLGRAGLADSSTPLQVTGAADIIAVAAGAEHSLALTSDGKVFGWGRNTVGQLGNNETKHVNITATQVSGLTNIMEIAAGDNHSYALKQTDSTIWAWGSNTYGQLGDGGKENKLVPVQVKGISDVAVISSGDNHAIALKADGTVWTWGRNTYSTASFPASNRTAPIQIRGLSDAVAIGGGGGRNGTDSYTLAVHRNGTLWYWDSWSADTTTQEPIFNQIAGIEQVKQPLEYPFVQRDQVLFRYDGKPGTEAVTVSGSFNDWVDIPLTDADGDNMWELQVSLPSGEYHYGFKVNGQWTVDPLNRKKTMNGLNPLSVLTVAPYAKVSPTINGSEVTFTYSSYDYNGKLEKKLDPDGLDSDPYPDQVGANTEYVAVVGNFSNGEEEIPMKKLANNTWVLTKTLKPGNYLYSYIVRDSTSKSPYSEKRNDPLNPNLQTNSITGIVRNTFTVSELLPTNIPVTGISLSKGPTLDLVVGEIESVQETIMPANASNKSVTWASTAKEVVQVDENGQMTAHAPGTAVIICTTANGKTAYLTVTVNPKDNALSYPRVGYKIIPAKTGVDPNKVWIVQFSKAIDENSLVLNTVAVVDATGENVHIARRVLPNDPTKIEVRLADGYQYKPGATYYLFIEKTVKTTTGVPLKEPVQMKFTIKL